MDEYDSLSHGKWECKYHVVFIPKCRRKTLYVQLRKHLGEVFRKLAGQKKSRIEEGHLLPDHAHMLVAIPPKYAVSQVIGFIKGKSAIHLARVYGERKQNFVGTALQLLQGLRSADGAVYSERSDWIRMGVNTYIYVDNNPLKYFDFYGLDRLCGPGKVKIGTNPDGSINCVSNNKPDESACFDVNCKIFSPSTNSQCFNSCISERSKLCAGTKISRDFKRVIIRTTTCITDITIECTKDCNEDICAKNKSGENCFCR